MRDHHPLVDYHEWGPEAPPSQPSPSQPPLSQPPAPDKPALGPPAGFRTMQSGPLDSSAALPREQVDHAFDGFAVRGVIRARPTAQEIVPLPDVSTAIVKPATPTPPWPDRGFDNDRDYPIVMWWTAIWYAIPTVVYTIWALMQSSSPEPGCASVTGGVCRSPRTNAIEAVTHHLVAIVIAAMVSAAVAAGIHRWTLAWRAITVGFAAAVIGAGAVTLVVSAIG